MIRINTLHLIIIIVLIVSLAGCAAKLQGTVIDRDTQKPIEGVRIKLKDEQGRSLRTTTTGEDGSFEISNLDQKSKYTLTFDGNNIVSQEYNLKELSEIIKLETTISIEGRVLDKKTQEPIKGANVMPQLEDEQGNLSDALTVAQFTDKQGGFSISNLAPGRYRLFINHGNCKATYYPQKGSPTYELQRGEDWRDITILLECSTGPSIPEPSTQTDENKVEKSGKSHDEVTPGGTR